MDARPVVLFGIVALGLWVRAASADLTAETSLTERGLRLGDETRSVTLFPYLQLDAGDASEGETDSRDVRRARLYAIGRAERFGAAYVPELSTDEVLTIAAYVDWSANERTTLRLGQHTAPFSLVNLTSSRFRTFAERPAAATLYPGLGFGLAGSRAGEAFAVGGGVYGGNVDTGVADGAPAIVLHASVAPRRSTGDVLHVGVGLGVDDVRHADVPPAFAGSAGSALAAPALTGTGAIEDAATLLRANLDLARVSGPFSVQAEATVVRVRRDGASDATLHGGYAFATWSPTGESRPYEVSASDFRRIEPTGPVRWNAGGGGAWELGVRGEWLDLDALGGGRQRALSVVANWYATRRLRALLDTTWTRARGGPDASGTTRATVLRVQLAW